MANETVEVPVWFATNRNPLLKAKGSDVIADFGDDLGPIDGKAVRFGKAFVRITRKGQFPSDWDVKADHKSLYVAPETLTATVKDRDFNPKVGSRLMFDEMRDHMRECDKAKIASPAIAFVHGFANSFWQAIERAGMIGAFYTTADFRPNMFAFTWPSKGRESGIMVPVVDYIHDRTNAERSGDAMARTLRILLRYMDNMPEDEWCRQKLHLVAHSMGNFALRHGIQALMHAPNIVPPAPALAEDQQSAQAAAIMAAMPTSTPAAARLRGFFDEIILAAADEDEDAFSDSDKFKLMPRIASRVTVYHTREDWILSRLSKYTKFNGPRLGTDGPENMPTISDKVRSVDVSKAVNFGDEMQGHQYYRQFTAVRDDIVAVLKGTPDDKIGNRALTGSRRFVLNGP